MITNEQVDLAYKYAYAWCKGRKVQNEDVVQDGMERFVVTMNNGKGFAEAIKKMINKMDYSLKVERAYENRTMTVGSFSGEVNDLPVLAAELITDGQFMDRKIDFDNLVRLILADCNPLQRKVLGAYLNDKTYKEIGIEVGKSDRRISQVFKQIVEIGRRNAKK